MKIIITLTLSLISLIFLGCSDFDKVKERMIYQSISLYSGSCPCPYSTMSNGRRCGETSAYSKPGGASPLCYKSDISDKEASSFSKSMKLSPRKI